MKSILFLGDVYLDGVHDVGRLFDVPYVFNLEAPFCNEEKPVLGKINLGMRWNDFDLSFKRRPLAVCLANNHILDYGVAGLDNTLNVLSKKRIPFFGAGAVADHYQNPLYVNIGSQRIAFFGYCSAKPCLETEIEIGPAPLKMDHILRDIETHRNAADRIIINLHWGKEEAELPDSSQADFARKLIDAGAHAIVGHHAHSIQPVEAYAKGIIAYGLGNFIFPDLCLPTFFNKKGEYQRIYKKKQRKWNRSSIGLMIDVKNMKFDIKFMVQDGVKTLEQKNRYHRVAHKSITPIYEKLDRIAARKLHLRKLNIMCSNFLRSPSFRKLFNFLINRGIRR